VDARAQVPDEVTSYLLNKTGCDVADVRTVRLVSLAGQEFIAKVLSDTLKEHINRRKAPLAAQKTEGLNIKDRRPVLLTEDLSKALQQHGINARRPDYFVEKPTR
jgi:transcription initiation factor TFIID subunit 10